MRPKPRDLTRFFAVMLMALLALPALFNYRQTIASAAAQGIGKNDVLTKAKKTPRPRLPKAITVAPSNDNCANSIAINSCPFTDTKDTTDATDETGEPQSTCTLQANSVWYTVTTGASRRSVTVDTCGSNYDTAIMVWQVDAAQPCNFASFVDVACSDDFGGCGDGFQTQVNFTAEANQTYKIQIGGFDGETGSLTVNVACQDVLCDDIVVNGSLGLGSPDFPSVSGQQTPARLFRDGIASTCAAPKACPGPFGAGSFTFDAYTFTNESSDTQCVTVQYRPNVGCGVNAHAIVYLNSFSPTNLCLNYLADVGSSDDLDFSFEVPAGANFVVVIAANNPGGVGNGCAYQFTVVGNICEQFDFCVQSDTNPTQFIKINSTTGAYEFNDCLKGVVFTGTGVVSTSFCKITLTDRGPNPKRPDRAVNVLINPCTMRGDASVKLPSSLNVVTMGDSDITNNTCECPAQGPPPPPR
jgi:hypothetical protein